MQSAPHHVQEIQRLALLHELALLDAPAAPEFDTITAILRTALKVPVAVVCLVDAERQWFASHPGLDASETPRAQSFCAHAVADEADLCVADACADPRFVGNPLTTAAQPVRSYLGVPIVVQGLPLGTVCVIDHVARHDLELLRPTVQAAAANITVLLERRLQGCRAAAAQAAAVEELQALSDWSWCTDASGRLTDLDERFALATGLAAEPVLGLPLTDGGLHPDLGLAWSQQQAFRHLLLPGPAGLGPQLFSGLPQRDSQGQVIGWRGSAQDPQRAQRAQSRADAAEVRLFAAMERFAGGVMLLDASGCVVVGNACWQRIFGAAVQAGQAWAPVAKQCIDAGLFVQAEGREAMFEALLTGPVQSLTIPIELMHQGLWWQLHRQRLPDGGELFTALDITSFKDAEARWRHHAEIHRAVSELASDGIALVNMAGELLMHNAAAARLWRLGEVAGQLPNLHGRGAELVDETGRVLAVQDHPAQRALAEQIVLRGVRLGVAWAHEPVQWFDLDVLPLSNGREAVLIFRDVTEQRARAAGQAARHAVEDGQLGSAVPSLGDGAWQWNVAGNRVFFSEAWKRQIGFGTGDVETSTESWLSRLHPDDAAATCTALRRQIDGPDAHLWLVFRLREKHGHYRWISARGRILRDGEGLAVEAAGLMSDVTEQKLTLDAQAQRQAAEGANQAKSRFLSRVSHEIRTPLNAVLGFSQLLRQRRPALPGDVAEAVLRIHTAGQHLLKLVNDLLDVQRIEANEMPLSLEPVRWLEVAEYARDILQADAAAANVQIEIDHETVSPLWVRADLQRLRQVMLNLLSNAIKYTRAGTTVRVHGEQPECTVEGQTPCDRLLVTDQGLGLSPAQLQRLFQAFERLGRETSAIQGTGLGLVITRSLVEAMDGTVAVASQLQVGSCFSVSLPRSASRGAVLAPVTAPESTVYFHDRGPQARYRLLYLEDNPVNIVLMEEVVAQIQNWQLHTVGSGADAHAWLRQAQPQDLPDLMLLDAHLPDCHGIQLLQDLRNQHPRLRDTPAVMVTADAMPEDFAASLAAGFRDHWTKPIDIDRIIRTLRAWTSEADLATQ